MTPPKSVSFKPSCFDFQPIIRPLRREDVSAVVGMIADLAAHHGDAATQTEGALLRDAFGAAPWIKVLVCESDSGLIGYCVLHPLYRTQTAARGMELQHLFVKPEWRGNGIGGRLIKAALATARDNGCAYVNVGATGENVAAQSFYLHLGFEASAQLGLRFRWALPEPA
jgi:GNAT superfamily N-acetyltransferase